jgi:hypothetical protein
MNVMFGEENRERIQSDVDNTLCALVSLPAIAYKLWKFVKSGGRETDGDLYTLYEDLPETDN